MKDVSVLIPTAKRPHLLSTALESVARQTAIARIGEVLVIENGEDRGSDAVCKRFPNLPIRYLYRNPTISPSERTVSTLSEGSLPFVALLHDDDWWLDFHLERSLEKLEKEPSFSATYSSYLTTESEKDWFRAIHANYTAWFGNDQSLDGVSRTLNFKQTLLANLLHPGFHMSSLVFRRSLIEACFAAFGDGNEFDNDRTLAVELSKQGDMVFHDTPSVVIRVHPEQESLVPWEKNRHFYHKNTRRLIQQARENSIDIPSEFSRRFSRSGNSVKMALNYANMASNGFEILAVESLLPPAVLDQYRPFAVIHHADNLDLMRLISKRRYQQGEVIRFQTGGESADYPRVSWGFPENWGTWTIGHQALLYLPLETPFQGAALLTVEAQAFLPNPLHELRVSVFCEHTLLGEWVINQPQQMARTLDIPARVLNQKTELVLEFRITNPCSPAEWNHPSTDTRLLGLGVSKVSIAPAQPILPVWAGMLPRRWRLSLLKKASRLCAKTSEPKRP